LYWAYERSGLVERLVSDAEIERFVNEPPDDTRAWARSKLLRAAPPEAIEHVDWDEITFQIEGAWPRRRTVFLDDPLGFTKTKSGFLESATLKEALDGLGAEPAEIISTPIIAPPPAPILSFPPHIQPPRKTRP